MTKRELLLTCAVFVLFLCCARPKPAPIVRRARVVVETYEAQPRGFARVLWLKQRDAGSEGKRSTAWIAFDVDADGDVDLADFEHFAACFTGPNRPYSANDADRACWWCDPDSDGDVDLADFAVFQACFNGPNRPPKAGCYRGGDGPVIHYRR